MTMSEQQQSTESPAGNPVPVESQAAPLPEPVAAVEPADNHEPATEQESGAEAGPPAQKPKPAKSTRKTAVQRGQRASGQDPAVVADYFTACPRCSFFLAGYRLIFQDFDEAATDAADDWLDLSWNLAVRNLIAKNYGFELAEPFEVFQGVCPLCLRAFIVETGEDEAEGHRFSIQINPRT